MLFSVVPFSHNCGTKITLISINKAKSYQHLQRLKSVSVNDLAIDVFGCFLVLFPDAKVLKDINQYILSRYLARDRAESINRLAYILADEIRRDAEGEAFARTKEGGAGIAEGLDVALVGDQGGVAVSKKIAL